MMTTIYSCRNFSIVDYTEKSLVVFTDSEWGRANAQIFRDVKALFGKRYTNPESGEKMPGWVVSKGNKGVKIPFLRKLVDIGGGDCPVWEDVIKWKTDAVAESKSEEVIPRMREVIFPRGSQEQLLHILFGLKMSEGTQRIEFSDILGDTISCVWGEDVPANEGEMMRIIVGDKKLSLVRL